MREKKSYTIPVLLLIIVGLAMLAVVLASRLLIGQQNDNTDKGMRIAEQYTRSAAFAQSLADGASGLLDANTVGQRMEASRSIGRAQLALDETVQLLAAYERYVAAGDEAEAAVQRLTAESEALADRLNRNVGSDDGTLSDADRQLLGAWRDGAQAMADALARFQPDETKEGYRELLAGGEWVVAAGQARQAFADMAAKLPS